MYSIDLPALIIIQRYAVIKKAIEQVRKIRVKNQVIYVLNKKNRPPVDLIHELLSNFNILICQKSNAGQTSKWTGPFKFFSVKSETYKIYLPSSFTKFQSRVVKSYLVDNENDENNSLPTTDFLSLAQDLLPDTSLLTANKILSILYTILFQVQPTPIRYQNMAVVSTFLYQKDSLSPPTPKAYMESKQKKLNGLFEKLVFEVVSILKVLKNIKIFNSCFVDEIKILRQLIFLKNRV